MNMAGHWCDVCGRSASQGEDIIVKGKRVVMCMRCMTGQDQSLSSINRAIAKFVDNKNTPMWK